ncbi:MAG: ABC transporter substrate-binding protein [Acidimicrobiia bacterium]|nr:ABC transporter substrate-binding protein [Acidimicrobiia bacterium]
MHLKPTISATCVRVALLLFGAIFVTSRVSADEVRVMTSGGLAAPHLALVAAFERTTGYKVVTLATSAGIGQDAIVARVRRGEPVDVFMNSDQSIRELIDDGVLARRSRVPIARSGIGVAVRKGAPKPDISTVDALKTALLNAKSIAYSAQVSGIYLSTELFPRLGIADQVKSKSQRVERERVGAVIARGEAEIGFQQISELLPIEGIEYLGPLPAEAQRITLFSAGVSAKSAHPAAARAFAQFFLSPEGLAMLKKYGMEPATTD